MRKTPGPNSNLLSPLNMGGFNCGLKAVPNQPKWAWTCPCGRGYWDAIKKEFITGDRVGTGEARTRAEYEAHLRECSQCRAQARQDILISVPGEEEGQGTQSSVRVRSSTRRVVSLDSEAAPVPRYHYFLPMEDIHPEVMQKAAKRYLGPEASIKLASNQVCFQLADIYRQGISLISSCAGWYTWLRHTRQHSSHNST